MTAPTRRDIEDLRNASAAHVRATIRAGDYDGPTAGVARGFAQANLVIVPANVADAFEEFCRLNAQACPLLERLPPGEPVPRAMASDADLRTDVPRYRVFRDGQPQDDEPRDIVDLWRDDSVAFLLGCSFTFENALEAAGLALRHIKLGRNVPMYRTNRPCTVAEPFSGWLVVSMRPFEPEAVEQVIAVTERYPRMHGAPVHVGDPAALGIADVMRPDFGDAVPIREGEVPVFWACGVTPQLALEQARLDWAVTHSPGCMFITDRSDEEFCQS